MGHGRGRSGDNDRTDEFDATADNKPENFTAEKEVEFFFIEFGFMSFYFILTKYFTF